jgi:hypothetical protein
MSNFQPEILLEYGTGYIEKRTYTLRYLRAVQNGVPGLSRRRRHKKKTKQSSLYLEGISWGG